MDRDPGKNKDPPTSPTPAGAVGRRTGDTESAAAGGGPPPIPATRTRRLNRTADASPSSGIAAEPTVLETSDSTIIKDDIHEQLETSTITRTYTTRKVIHQSTEFHESSSSSSSVQYVADEELDSPSTPHRLRQKVAEYEKVWSSGGSLKRSPDESAEELRREFLQSSTNIVPDHSTQAITVVGESLENPFDIDVLEIEKRLRRERQRGLAEAEAAKLAFQQVQLRHTPQPSPRRVEVQEDYTALPFNVTLRTTTKLSSGDEAGYVEAGEPPVSPFNVTLRTTRRIVKKDLSTSSQQYEEESSSTTTSPFNVTLRTTTRRGHPISPVSPGDPKNASARFLESEKTVREVHAADGIRTIVTSSMTSDGRKHEEKIFRHGEGYVSPRCSPQRENRPFFEPTEREREGSVPRSASSRSSATPPRTVDMTAGGRRILIRLEDETHESSTLEENYDITDSVQARIRQLARSPDGGGGAAAGAMYNVAMGTLPGNIDITVGSTHHHHHHHPHQLQHYQQQPQQQPQVPGQWYYQEQRLEQQMDTNNTVENMIVETQEQAYQQQQHQQQSIPWQMSKSTHSGQTTVPVSTTTGEAATGHTTTGTHTASILETTGQSHDSSTEESQRVVSRKKKTTTEKTTTTTHSSSSSSSSSVGRQRVSEEREQRQAVAGKLTRPTGLALSGANVRLHGDTVGQEKIADNLQKSEVLTDDSDTEGVAAKNLVIVPTRVEQSQTAVRVSQTPTQHSPSPSSSVNASASASVSASASAVQTPTTPSTTTASGTFGKSLTGHQTLQQQSTQDEYQEFQSTMAAINFARSNSQYDSHIREKRGKYHSYVDMIIILKIS
ncbi:unnamed protein product [Ceratitis capitata]|uniref:(Mediterranean fruit fly) hypothetical protein n=1 Tax=Ceratitis capitata TaxID=7213 RepID=A0A811UPR5_CERCA|nr:unnamed protein product [Ceratitis capitata]